MKALLPAILLATLGLGACSTEMDLPPAAVENVSSLDEDLIRDVLQTQQDAWNRGDIPAFMEGYWKSEDLRFASRADITLGWQETLDRYLKSYDSAEKMGKLDFDIAQVDVLGPSDALVFGRWELMRTHDTPHGVFTLHFRKIDGQWVIVSDHTSGADDK